MKGISRCISLHFEKSSTSRKVGVNNRSRDCLCKALLLFFFFLTKPVTTLSCNVGILSVKKKES